MMNEKNTAIITCIDQNYEENLEFDFLETLFNKAKYSGKVIVLDYGMSEVVSERIRKKFPVLIYRLKKELAVFAIRFKHIPQVLRTLDEEIKQVLVIDGGDVWFQQSLWPMFELTENKIGVITEDRIVGEDDWTDRGMNNLSVEMRDQVMHELKGRRVINAGVVCGDREKMEVLYRKVYNDILACGIEYFGVDQLFLNCEWYKLEETEKTFLDNQYNYVVISHDKEEYSIKDDIIYTKNGDMITVVHNAGGNWRVIERPFKNKYVNEQQYYIENINRIAN
ncbi:MAG: hypothetical protein PUC73_12365 [Lachnospiraceae bacterium]|nr:hypothetical protein [Lachnospiraceae bacterium]